MNIRIYKNYYRYYRWFPIGLSIGFGKAGIDCYDTCVSLDISFIWFNFEIGIVWYSKKPDKENYN
jgi:hypothetical protein